MPIDIAFLTRLVREAALEELLPRYQQVAHTFKADGSVLTEADLAMDRRLRETLAAHWPDTAFLSEEMEPAEQEALLANSTQPLWCLDPLDGTSNFAAGLPFFGVSLALIANGQVLAGVIYDPVRDECFSALRGQGATLNGRPLQAESTGLSLSRSIALVDLKRLTPGLRSQLAVKPPYHSQRNFGSCALEWAWMAAGRGHIYLHGGQKLWDLAAGTLILSEAGGICRTLEGEEVFVAAMQPRSVVSSPDKILFEEWAAWISAHCD